MALGWAAPVLAQDKPRLETPPPKTVTSGAAGIQGQNIFDVKPDASEEPGYATQTNGEAAPGPAREQRPDVAAGGAGLPATAACPRARRPKPAT